MFSRRASIAIAVACGLTRAVAAQDQLSLSGIEVHATIHSLSVVVDYGGDDNGDAVAQVEYRTVGAPSYRVGPMLARLPGARFAGVVLEVTEATDWDVRVRADDPDLAGPLYISGSARTRATTPPPPPPTGGHWWVDGTSGDNANPGTMAQPFRTITRGVNAAAAGDMVHVLPAVYREQVVPPRGGAPGAPLWIVAEGAGVVIDGADAAIAAGPAWTSEGGDLYSIPFTGVSRYLAIDDTRVYDYTTLAGLLAEDGDIGQPGVFPGGFFVDGAAGRLYLITPWHDDPATHQVNLAVRASGFLLDGLTDVVIDGFEIRHQGSVQYSGVGVDIRDSASCWVRSNWLHHLNTGVRVRRPLASDNVIEGNRFRDTSVWNWPWSSVKAHTAEASAITVNHGRGNIVRWNQLDGSFNGIGTGAFSDPDEAIARDTDVYENLLWRHGDDGLEPEGAQVNVRFRENRIDGVYNAISVSPIEVGPVYLQRTLIDGYKTHAVKVNNGTPGAIFLNHTTARPVDGAVSPDVQALAPSIPFGAIVARNNIWEANRYVIEYGQTTLLSPVDWDYDNLFTNDSAGAGRFVKWLDVRYADGAALAASMTIEGNGFSVAPAYVDPAAGDFNLVAGHPLVDAGQLIAGINDDRVAGAGPDVGAFERGAPPPGREQPRLLRNADWPATKASIFTGSPRSCPPPLDLGCGPARPSLDALGPDCAPGAGLDDDVATLDFACGSLDPNPTILTDRSRSLVFYQVDRAPSACNRVRVVVASGRPRIDCD